jgi:hypothetical protein
MNNDLKTILDAIIERSLMNWSRAAQSDPAFMARVFAATSHLPQDIPTKDRIYAAASGTDPICPHGQTRTLKNVVEGWKGCGKAGKCACAREALASSIKKTKAANRAKQESDIVSVSGAVQIEDGAEQLRALIERVGRKHYTVALRKNPVLAVWVMQTTATMQTNTGIPERVFTILNGPGADICKRGNQKTFAGIEIGYRFCATDCDCRREEQANKMREHHAALDAEEKGARLARQKATMLERHGADNAAKVPEFARRTAETNMERYGAPTPFESPEIRAKAQHTLSERHGVHAPMLIPGVPEKVAATNIERYGSPHTMGAARTSFAAANGGLNPFQVPEIIAKVEASMMERHGVIKPLLSPVILQQMQDRFEEKHGFRNPMHVQQMREKLETTVTERYGRTSPNKAHFSETAWTILQDRDLFVGLFASRPLREVAETLQIAYDTCRKWCVRHGVDLPKSTYEDAIADFLRAKGMSVKVGDRKIIAPQEIDIALPDAKVGIEFCGLYWHSEKNKRRRSYHLDKHLKASAVGWRLLTIFEDEWVNSRPIVEARILNVLGLSSRGPGARSLNVQHIRADEARDFLNRNHSQGGGAQGFVAYGAFDAGMLCAVMTFSKPRSILSGHVDGPVELLRFSTDGRVLPGVASKLFTAFTREYAPTAVISYADRRWSEGGMYRALGFEGVGASDPGYFYFHPNRGLVRHHRSKFQRHKIVDLVPESEGMSEAAIMDQLGYLRIWDCGSYKFLWKRPPSS